VPAECSAAVLAARLVPVLHYRAQTRARPVLFHWSCLLSTRPLDSLSASLCSIKHTHRHDSLNSITVILATRFCEFGDNRSAAVWNCWRISNEFRCKKKSNINLLNVYKQLNTAILLASGLTSKKRTKAILFLALTIRVLLYEIVEGSVTSSNAKNQNVKYMWNELNEKNEM